MADQWLPQFAGKDVFGLEEKELFSGYSRICRYSFQHPLFSGGQSHSIHREVFLRPKAIAVLLLDPDQEQIVLIEQFRVGALSEPNGPWLLEIVAGVVDEHEDLEKAAFRETKEETGCTILSLLPVGAYLASPGVSNEKLFIYCGRVQAPKTGIYGLSEEGEDIKVHVLSIETAFQLLAQGKIVSAPAVIALQWLHINRFALRFPQEIE